SACRSCWKASRAVTATATWTPCWSSKTFWRRSGDRSNEKEGLSLLFFVTAPCADSPPLHPNIFLGLAAPTPLDMQALRESMAKPCSAPRVTFPTRENHQRHAKGCRPWTLLSQSFRPLWCCAALALGLPPATTKDRFATLS